MQTRKKKINSQRLVAANLRIPLDKKKKNERMRGKNVLCNAEILSSVGYFTRIEFTVFKWAQGTIYKLQASNTSDEICNGKIFVVEQFIKYSRTSSSWIKAMGILFFFTAFHPFAASFFKEMPCTPFLTMKNAAWLRLMNSRF